MQATIEGEELEPTDYGKALGNLRVTVDNRSIAYLEVRRRPRELELSADYIAALLPPSSIHRARM